jgi:hypothetical protein
MAKQIANFLGNRGGWEYPIPFSEFVKKVPNSVRLSTLSAAILKAHFSEVLRIAGRATDEYLHALVTNEANLDVFPSLYGLVRLLSRYTRADDYVADGRGAGAKARSRVFQPVRGLSKPLKERGLCPSMNIIWLAPIFQRPTEISATGWS